MDDNLQKQNKYYTCSICISVYTHTNKVDSLQENKTVL